MRLLLKILLIAGSVWVAAAFVPGVAVSGGAGSYLWIAVVFAAVNLLVKPVLKLLSFPLVVLTLGLFLVVINAAMLGLTAALTGSLSVAGLEPAIVAALVISAVTWVGENVLRLDKR